MITDPLDDIRQLLDKLPGRHPSVGRPKGSAFDSMGRLGQLADWLKVWSGGKSTAARPSIAIFAGAHGLSSHVATPETDVDTGAFVEAAGQGTVLISRICSASNIGLKVLELALDYPTGDISRQPALDPRGAAATMAFGMEAAAGGNDLLCLSSVGAGGGIAAAALLAALGRADGKSLGDPNAPKHLQMRQADLVAAALARTPQDADGLALIAELGGREIAAVAGAIIAARMERIPVVLDGLPAIAAALALSSMREGVVDHCRLATYPQGEHVKASIDAAGLASVSGESLAAAPGIESALAIQTLRLAAT